MSDKITRLATRCGATADIGRLFHEWCQLRDAKGRTDEQAAADGDRTAEIENLMATTPAANLPHVEAKLIAYAEMTFGSLNDAHPLVASALDDLGKLDGAWRLALGGLDLSKLVAIADMAEDLQCHLDTYARAAGALGNALSAMDAAPDDASLAYAASNTLRSLHREATDLVNVLYEAKAAAKSAAA